MYTRCKINVKFSLSSSVTLLNKLNLTSDPHFVDLAVKNLSVVLPEYGPLRAETY